MDHQNMDNQPAQGDEYIRLGYLLKRKRDEENNILVEKILNSEINITDKIQKIEELDKRLQERSNHEQTEKPLDKDKIRELFIKNHIITEKSAKKNTEKIKKRIFRLPYLLFVFSEFRKIKQFARETRTIVARYFPPRIRVDAELKHRLFLLIQKDASEIFPHLEKLLSSAWQILEKEQYNLIVQFQNLCIVLANIRFNNLDFNSPHLLDSLLSVERMFLVCYRESGYPEIIINSISELIDKSNYEKDQAEKFEKIVRRILLPEEQQPSLYYMLLASNMVKFRKYLTIQDILNTNTEPVINTFQFDCNEKTRAQIDQFLKEKTELLERHAREKYEIEKVHHFLVQFIQEDREDGYDFRILSAFYTALSDKEKYHFSQDLSKLEVMIPRFVSGFLENFEPFLTHAVKFEKYGLIKVFSPEFINYEVARLRSFLEKFYKELFNCPQISLTRFLNLKKNSKGKGASTAEMNLVQIIEEIGEIFFEIGKKVSEILIHYNHPDSINPNAVFQPLEPSRVMLQNSIIPFWKEEILSDNLLGHKTTRDGIEYIVNLSLMFGILLENQNMFRLLNRKSHVSLEFEELKKIIKRIADVITFEKIESNLNNFPF